MSRTLKRALLLGFSSAVLFQAGVSAQDIELLGRFHGTRPPQGYYDRMAQDPGAYQFQRALIRRGLDLPEAPRIGATGRDRPAAFAPALSPALAGRPRRAPVSGVFKFPLVLGLYSDSPEPEAAYTRNMVQAEVWDGPQANPNARGTIPEFYAEVSRGLVSLSGTTFDWVRTGLTQAVVTDGESGIGGDAQVGGFIVQIIQGLDDGTVDWGQFDNDGPDGVPNSGDDDGFVDILTIMHPTSGGECGSEGREDRIWSHKWNLYSAAHWEVGSWVQPVKENLGYTTTSAAVPSPDNPTYGFIRILDYTIQPVTTCSETQPNTIGVTAHELGHGFGLPDLYNTGSAYGHSGIGNWGLMGTGSWGCNGSSAQLPCHMTAWSKEVLGWGDVETLPPGTDLGTVTLTPVETTGKIFRIDAGDGSGEYYLLENRQRTGFDLNLLSPGLLVWHVDPASLAANWRYNTVNADPAFMGVWLREADGRSDLIRAGGGRGDASDPFPGSLLKTELHAGTSPGSWSHDGGAMGITLLDIQLAGSDLTLRPVTGYQPLTLETVGSPSGLGLISVDGVTSQAPSWVYNSAPFQTHTITAASGEATSVGRRVGFQGWSDGAPREREFQTQLEDVTLTATYAGTEVHIDIGLTGPVQGISPGTIDFTPGDEEGWVGEGESVVITALPQTGFGFQAWSGALAGHPNPTTLVADAPMMAGAVFDLTFSTGSNPPSLEIEAATSYFLALEVDNANLPVTWTQTSGEMPEGMRLDPIGRISGSAMERGTFPLSFHVVDGIGLEGDLSLDLVVEDPQLSIERLASPFLLTGVSLDFNQKTYLDREGNVNGSYDLGDFRSFYFRNPNLPSTGDLQGIIELLVPMGDLKAGGSGKEVVR